MREDRELFHKPTREMVLTSNQDARVISRVKIEPAPLDRMLQRVKTARLIRDLPEAEQPQPATKPIPIPAGAPIQNIQVSQPHGKGQTALDAWA